MNSKDSKDTLRSSAMTANLIKKGLKKRYRTERLFQSIGLIAIILGLAAVLFLFTSIVGKGYGAFQQTYILLTVDFDKDLIDPSGDRDLDSISQANYGVMVKESLRNQFPDAKKRKDKRLVYRLVSSGAVFQLRELVMSNHKVIGQKLDVWVPADDDIDMLIKGHIDRSLPESDRRVSDKQIYFIDKLIQAKRLKKRFNTTFFSAGDSREPELAGIGGAAVGTMFTIFVTLLLAFPLGIFSAIYLEEFAPRNRWTDLIEVNINNLAAVPSIVFGLLGLSVFLNFFHLPRSAPVVGGLVLALMTLPTIIIAGRAALQSVPPSVREAALGIGASAIQTTFHHIVPLAMPGMLTGSIIGMARAIGETAPLLMIGMVAFIVDIPKGFTDPSTVLPVQIFLWLDSPERAFVERSSAAIMVLLTFLILINGLAAVLRRRYERRW